MKVQYLIAIMLAMAAGSASAREVTARLDKPVEELDLRYAHVLMVRAENTGDSWRFDVTVRHGDTGWDHYADLWVVIDTETGREYGRRVLVHPHENEQPFTRSQYGIVIPRGVKTVTVRASCTVHGFGGEELTFPLN